MSASTLPAVISATTMTRAEMMNLGLSIADLVAGDPRVVKATRGPVRRRMIAKVGRENFPEYSEVLSEWEKFVATPEQAHETRSDGRIVSHRS